jgi:pyridoxamine 5'-phosphate oxidase
MEQNKDIVFDADPFALFHAWFELAQVHEINDPGAMSLATVDDNNMPNVRMVLNRGYHENGFRFLTNSESTKGNEMNNNQNGAICFHWKSLRRQVRAQGQIIKVPDEESDEYFARRPRESQIGAWASQQSRPLDSMQSLQARIGHFTQIFDNQPIPRPAYWFGYRLMPQIIEFWAERPFRLHERMRYTAQSQGWQQERLYP